MRKQELFDKSNCLEIELKMYENYFSLYLKNIITNLMVILSIAYIVHESVFLWHKSIAEVIIVITSRF
jgi:hypothetical protein